MTDVSFVTWDGPDSPYLETLFLPVFRRLSARGWRVHVLQFTWASKRHVRRQAAAARVAGVGYTACPVLRGPAVPSAAAMVAGGALAVRFHAWRNRVSIVMPRSILPAAMVLAARPMANWEVAFDADGFAADERVEFAGWSPNGATYRVWRDIEARAVRAAASVVTRTDAAKLILVERAGAGTAADKISVIPNARDPDAFAPGTEEERRAVRAEWGARPSDPCVLYAGSLGTQYFPDEMLALYERIRARRSDARLVLLTRDVEAVRSALGRVPVDETRLIVRAVDASRMGPYVAAADLGLALRAPTFSQRAVSPVKVAEYLLCGVPIVATPVGDLARQLDAGAGLLIGEPDAPELDRAAAFFVDDVMPNRGAMRASARETGIRHFALETAVDQYDRALAFSLGRKPTR